MAAAEYAWSGTWGYAHPDPDPDPEIWNKSPNCVPDPSETITKKVHAVPTNLTDFDLPALVTMFSV